jgi:RimJ/RimL family protein N-acetyltransferase
MKKIKWEREVKTKRLILRPYTQSDYVSWAAGFRDRGSKKDLFDPGPIPEKMISKEIFKKTIHKHKKITHTNHIYIYKIFNKKTRENIGLIDIFVIARYGFQWGNLGYQIHNQYCRRGYAKESAKAALKIAFNFLNLHRVEATMETNHKASIAVVKAIGMKKECVRKRFYREKNHWSDMTVFVSLAN